eukprot:UN33826
MRDRQPVGDIKRKQNNLADEYIMKRNKKLFCVKCFANGHEEENCWKTKQEIEDKKKIGSRNKNDQNCIYNNESLNRTLYREQQKLIAQNNSIVRSDTHSEPVRKPENNVKRK